MDLGRNLGYDFVTLPVNAVCDFATLPINARCDFGTLLNAMCDFTTLPIKVAQILSNTHTFIKNYINLLNKLIK